MNTQEVKTEALSVFEKAQGIKVVDDDSYATAGQFVVSLRGVQKRIDETFGPIVAKAYETHKEAVLQKKKTEEPIQKAASLVKFEMQRYKTEVERKRREEEERLRVEAKKKAEERLIAEALEAEQSGDKELAQEIINEPVQVAPVVVKMEAPKVEGISTRKLWKFNIVDASKVPDEYKIIDQSKIGAVVRALKDQTNIPGVEVYSEDQVIAKAI